MPKRTKITETVFARGVAHIADDINDIESKHRIAPADLVRGLLEAAVAFYREHGFFSFPVRIEPEAFQREWLAAEHGQAGYPPAKALNDQLEAAREELRRKDLAAGAGRKRRRRAPGSAPA